MIYVHLYKITKHNKTFQRNQKVTRLLWRYAIMPKKHITFWPAELSVMCEK